MWHQTVMTTDDKGSGDFSEEELRCLHVLFDHHLQSEPPPVSPEVSEATLHRLEARGLVKRITEPMLPLEMKRVNYCLTAAGAAAFLAAQKK